MDWVQVVVMMVVMMGTVLGVVIPLHLHTLTILKGIQDEIKDFHGRLCSIEERNKSKLV